MSKVANISCAAVAFLGAHLQYPRATGASPEAGRRFIQQARACLAQAERNPRAPTGVGPSYTYLSTGMECSFSGLAVADEIGNFGKGYDCIFAMPSNKSKPRVDKYADGVVTIEFRNAEGALVRIALNSKAGAYDPNLGRPIELYTQGRDGRPVLQDSITALQLTKDDLQFAKALLAYALHPATCSPTI